jgi:hypothetical protein
MNHPTIALAEIERVLAAQDQMLAASYEKLDPRKPLTVSIASLRRLVAFCASPRPLRGPAAPAGQHEVRC